MAYERLLDKEHPPSEQEMLEAIGEPASTVWNDLRRFIAETYAIEPEIQYGGKKYGWNVHYRKGGRTLTDLFPEVGAFTALVVLGKAEAGQALECIEEFGPNVKHLLTSTPALHDGTWLSIRVHDAVDGEDVKRLLRIKRKPARKKLAAR